MKWLERPLAIGTCLGVLGGGQLGRYFVLEARRLGFRTVVLDPDPTAPAMQLGDTTIVAAYDDTEALKRLAGLCDAVTLEFENIPLATLDLVADLVPLAPRARHVAIAQDRRLEKRLADEQGLPTVPWQPVEREEQARTLHADCLPGILKTARLGYDGKGQAVCRNADEVLAAWQRFGRVACVLEKRLALGAEVSVVIARAPDGTSAVYPPAENVHRDGVLHTSTVPSTLPPPLLDEAIDRTRRLVESLDYVGVLAVEYFVVSRDDGERALVFNEMAPRPHNSGHWTLDAAESSQFEQQVRALAGWPLAGVRMLTPVTMLNLLGDADMGRRLDVAVARTGAVIHLYGKREARPGRKMGHVNCLAGERGDALAGAMEICSSRD